MSHHRALRFLEMGIFLSRCALALFIGEAARSTGCMGAEKADQNFPLPIDAHCEVSTPATEAGRAEATVGWPILNQP
jgi:hypothetical protein